jgi:thioredoxin
MRLLVVTSILFLFGACNSQSTQSNQDSTGVVNHVNATEFKSLIDQGECILLDVRTDREIGQGFIETASFINYPNETFEQKAKLMDRETPVLVYCHSGGRSANAAQVLVDLGFEKVYNLKGGIRGWKSNGLPTTASKMPIASGTATSVEAFKETCDSNEWVLVDFYTPWCAPCKKLDPIIESVTAKYTDSLTVVKVDADASSELAKSYQIVGVPVLVLMQNGQEVWRNNGLISEAELVKVIQEKQNQ